MPRYRRFDSLRILALPLVVLLGGCSYIHFGRADRFKTDATLAAENSDLRIERKLLQQELGLAHKENEVLRTAVDHQPAPDTAGMNELAAKLTATTHELTELRASYTRLQAERERLQPAAPATTTSSGRFAAAEQIADLRSKLGETEDRLAEALRNFTQLQAENQRLRASVEDAHAENATLARKLDQITAQNNEARSALTQLNTEFMAQKEARAQAEQAADALRTQLHAIAEHGRTESAPSLASARESSAAGAREIDSTLQVPGLAPDASTGATLSTSPARLHAASGTAASAPGTETQPTPQPAARPARTYIVQEGDSLEKISLKFYGRPDRWSDLYSANNDLLSGGRALTAGMKLQIPSD